MFSKTLLVFLVVYLLSNFSRGQKANKFFRNDYHYIESTKSFYKFHESHQNWRDAKQVCAQEGASLFYPETFNEADDVISFWNSTQPSHSRVFVGISALMIKGVFETIDDYIFNKDTGKCYKLHATPLSWNDAYAACRVEQSSLAVINDQQEMDYLAKLTESASKLRIGTDYQRGIFHLGFHNLHNEGWQTIKGTPFNDASSWWGNYQADVNDGKQCGSMFYTGRLNNVNCNTKSFFICEHEVKPVLSVTEKSETGLATTTEPDLSSIEDSPNKQTNFTSIDYP